jgi:hypothetical protein
MFDRLSLFTLVVTLATLALILERRRQLREKYALLWLGVGLVMLGLSLGRPAVDWVSNRIGVVYGPTVVFLFAILFLLGVAAHLSYEVSKLEEKTRMLAEEIALLRPRPPAERVD